MKLLLAGMNHRSAPVEVRERFAVEDPGLALAKLTGCAEIEEAILVSTCNRVEVLVSTREPEAARLRLESFFRHDLARDGEVSAATLDECLYHFADGPAVRHVFRVAASVDSLVVGEPQILGQMKDAYRAAVEAGACGVILNRLMTRAFSTAKRVRRETAIAERPVSVARVAVDLARQVFERFEDKRAVLVGAGEMIELALEALRGEGLGHVRVVNRTRARAEELAERFDAEAHGLDQLDALLADADVVLTCIGGDEPIIRREAMLAALRVRRGRPIFVIDIGVPRNVDPAVNEIDDVYLFDLDDLSGVAEENAEERRRETVRAEAIVAEEQQNFQGWMTALQAVPTIRDLRDRADEIRDAELDRYLARLGLDTQQKEGVEQLARSIVNKVLHAPLSRLRSEAEREEGVAYLEVARTLFGLDGRAGEGDEALPENDDDDEPEPQ
ncbi:MAG: glutamyl-tRNA reductase [Deltaproteobacteria bacterium]|nr:glutamyl-tRNA reductase [Deltaproteobacteria bacterium]MBW2445037.1 glutamyl-tRNA reductase [Deltaproteobacteria bacterium]